MKELIKESKDLMKEVDKDFLDELNQVAVKAKGSGKVMAEDLAIVGMMAEWINDIHCALCAMEKTHGYEEEHKMGFHDKMEGKSHSPKMEYDDDMDDEEMTGPRVRR